MRSYPHHHESTIGTTLIPTILSTQGNQYGCEILEEVNCGHQLEYSPRTAHAWSPPTATRETSFTDTSIKSSPGFPRVHRKVLPVRHVSRRRRQRQACSDRLEPGEPQCGFPPRREKTVADRLRRHKHSGACHLIFHLLSPFPSRLPLACLPYKAQAAHE